MMRLPAIAFALVLALSCCIVGSRPALADMGRSGAAGESSMVEAGAVTLDMPDGEYSIEVNMTGGNGRAQVGSPTWLIVEGGRAYARLLWSSPHFDYLVVDGMRYDNLTDDGGNSTFLVPVTVLDEAMDVRAATTAMGEPVEVAYHLTFYSATVGDKDAIPQEAAIKVLGIAVVIIVVGGVLNWALKRRRRR